MSARTTVILATLALVGHFSARGAVELAAAGLLHDVADDTPAWSPDAAVRARIALPDVDVAALFGVDPDREAVPPSAPGGDPAGTSVCDDPSARRLVGAVVRSDRALSFAAVVEASGNTELIAEGSITSGGTVVEIARESLVLERDGARCVLPMFAPDVPAPDTARDPIPTVTRLDDHGFMLGVRRADVLGLMADPGELLSTVRVMPHQENGEPVGFRVFGVRAGSLPYSAGLRNGDVVVSVAGRPVTDVGTIATALAALESAPQVEVVLDRGGTRLPITVVLQ